MYLNTYTKASNFCSTKKVGKMDKIPSRTYFQRKYKSPI